MAPKSGVQAQRKKRSRVKADAEDAPAEAAPKDQQEELAAVAEVAPAEPPPHKKQKRVKAAPPLFPPSKCYDLFTFGSNPFGALGFGEEVTLKGRPAQLEVEDEHGQPVRFVQVECGGMHSVALSSHGVIYTWGVNDEGALGRKTQGTAWENSSAAISEQSPDRPHPAALPGDMRAVAIAAGDAFTLALGNDGAIYGCGEFKDDVGGINGFTADTKMERTFKLLWSPPSSRDHVRQLVAGARHAAALTARGVLLTWGIGSQGQLGRVPFFSQETPQPTRPEVFVPLPVPGLLDILGSSPIASIACGAYTTFVISKAGDVAGWGLNNSGQLGIVKEGQDDNLKWEPQAITSLSHIKSIAGGEQHTLALTKAGVLLSFGAGTYGMLGRENIDVTSANTLHPQPQPITVEVRAKVDDEGNIVEPAKPMPAVSSAVAGTNVSACLSTDHIAYFWGSNTNFQLAKGGEDESDEPLPLKMRRAAVFGFRKIYQLSFGGQHAAMLAGPKPDMAPAAVPAPAAAAPAAAENGNGASTSTAV